MSFGLSEDRGLVADVLQLSIRYLPFILAAWIAFSYIRTWSHLRHIPGPWLAKFSYAFMAKTNFSGKLYDGYAEVNKKYGPLARIGPNQLITDDPDIVRRMSSARSAYGRADWYGSLRLDVEHDHILSILDTQKHDKLKAKLAGGYAGKENPHLESEIDDIVTALVSFIETKYISTSADLKPMDLAQKIQFFTLDVITKVAYGKEFGYISRDEDVHGYIKTLDELIPTLTTFAAMPIVMDLMNAKWVRKLAIPSPLDTTGMGKFMGVAKQVVSERFSSDKPDEKQDMIGAFIRHGVSARQIEAEIPLQIMAGSDTTATCIRGTLLHLITSVPILAKLRAEIDAAEAEGRISNPISNAEAKELPYLQAVIKEGLRMRAPFTGLVSKKVPPGGDTLNGQYVPGGTEIATNAYYLQRNAKIYGEDVEVFRPERWLEADAAKRQEMERTVDLVFGYGRWGCLGKQVAFIELNKTFVELLRRFDFVLVDPEKPWTSNNYNMWLEHDMWVRTTRRETKV